jgi:3-methyladenine DNA glycosylase AlkD
VPHADLFDDLHAARNRSVPVLRTIRRKYSKSNRDDMIVKALSWALREIAKHDAPRASRFLEHHRTHLAPRVVRELTNKLETGRKNPRRR